MYEVTKTCPKCKKSKPTNEFGLHTQATNSLKCWCKLCVNVYAKERSFIVRQNNLKLRFKKFDKAIALCDCGDYFVQVYYLGTGFTPLTREKCTKC